MSEQLTLDAFRATDPGTSRLAAADAAVSAGTLRDVALVLLRELGPMTDFELADAIVAAGFKCAGQPSAGKRRLELQRKRLVCRLLDPVTGAEVRRPAPSGSLAIVWRAVQ